MPRRTFTTHALARRRSGGCTCGVTADLLVQELGATLEQAEKAEAKLFPPIRANRTEDKVRNTFRALQERLGLSDAELKKVVLGTPPVLGMSIGANVLPSLAALQERLGLSDAELKKVVLRLPPVLGMSVEANVLPTLEFLQRELGLSDESLHERIVGNPVMLGYSLEKRLRPRLELCRKRGLPAEDMLFNHHSKTPEDFEALCGAAA